MIRKNLDGSSEEEEEEKVRGKCNKQDHADLISFSCYDTDVFSV